VWYFPVFDAFAGVRNAYFPMFVPEAALNREKDHVEGFAPEVAWVTQSGDTQLKEKIAIRPTSETIMYPAYAKWIRSHRDLPMRLNQWTNVVRWEFKNATPFIRTREFLWQEGHSAFARKAEADKEVLDVLDLYARVYEELLAVPVIKGRKSEVEKFAGGLYTTTVEAFIPTNGRAIQGATSHSLGQNFSRMFKITYADESSGPAAAAATSATSASADGSEDAAAAASASSAGDGDVAEDGTKHVWQNSWGITTRTIGVMVMVHGDDKGLVMPPRVAPVQVAIVPIAKASDAEGSAAAAVLCKRAYAALSAAGIRVELDERDVYTAGWKFSHWEQKGVPIRLEIGTRDAGAGTCVLVTRHSGAKEVVSVDDDLASGVSRLLETIQADMLENARRERDGRVSIVTEWKDFLPALERGNMVLAPWSETMESEEWVKAETKRLAEAAAGQATDERAALSGAAKTLCIPMDQPAMPEGQLCFTGCGKPATAWALWGRSY
jgi:prolyl-tRNA synthetase